jgi:ParB family transcriptional regulator, chromosome partitioning protein
VPPKTARRPSLADFEIATVAVPPIDDRLVHRLPVDTIRLSGRNPRVKFPALDELADSLREHGLLQPIVVRRIADGGYELIAGHRRLEAARTLGWAEISAVVRDDGQEQAYILTLVENLQREDLSAREEAAALEVLVRERGWTTRQIGLAIKRSHIYVSRRLRVFEDPALAPLVLGHKLAVSTAEELLRVPDVSERKVLARRAVREGWERAQVRAALEVRADGAEMERSVPNSGDRGRQVVLAVTRLRKLLEAGPVADLPDSARVELRDLYRRLALLATG